MPACRPLSFLLALGTTLAAQGGEPSRDQQQPTFVTGTQYVRVDLYVTRDGLRVDDLRPEEVALSEDGVPQVVDRFERIVFGGQEPIGEPRSLETTRRRAADPRSRVFVVFLDRWHSSYLSPVTQRRFPVLRQFESMITPHDLVAVMTPEMRVQDLTFGRDLAGLAQLEGDWAGPESIIQPGPGNRVDDTERLYLACYPPPANAPGTMIGRRREKMALDALEDLVTHLGELREERSNVLLITDGWPLVTPDMALAEFRQDDALRLPLPLGGRGRENGPVVLTERGALTVTPDVWRRCEADRIALALLDHTNRLRQIVQRAAQSNVSLYPVSTAGLSERVDSPGISPRSGGPRASSLRRDTVVHTTRLARQSELWGLAEQTGGDAIINTNNLTERLTRIVDASSAYYLLGYASTNSRLDGRYRRITVKVSRPGITVSARPGYVAAPPATPTTGGRPAVPAAADPVRHAFNRMAATDQNAPLMLRAAAWAGSSSSGGTTGGFWLVAELDARLRREPAWAKGAIASVAVFALGGEAVVDDQVAAPRRGPALAVRVPASGRLAPGEYSVQVRLQAGNGADALLETIRVTVNPEPMALGDAMLWRAGPFSGPTFVPTADLRFSRRERLRLDVPSFSDEPAIARLLDRAGAPLNVPVPVTERVDPAQAFRWMVVDLTLSPLTAGDYAIELAQGEMRQVTAFRIIP